MADLGRNPFLGLGPHPRACAVRPDVRYSSTGRLGGENEIGLCRDHQGVNRLPNTVARSRIPFLRSVHSSMTARWKVLGDPGLQRALEGADAEVLIIARRNHQTCDALHTERTA